MAHLKVFARRTMIVAGAVVFFSAASAAAYGAAGIAVTLGGYATGR
jgi:hypothetical protein